VLLGGARFPMKLVLNLQFPSRTTEQHEFVFWTVTGLYRKRIGYQRDQVEEFRPAGLNPLDFSQGDFRRARLNIESVGLKDNTLVRQK